MTVPPSAMQRRSTCRGSCQG
ncbi:hypothetical protein NGA_0227400 [Nannochloropsis gaditana CCMP526]|nr:hypothetical protein NGA_0227400 [Nannochloropsis gaditana CCMP526]EKU22018.1 hypothetical protein NGA_0227400 [Nannochloropsis gaditana CCMP526]|eukprot:XP_005854342.1 hypothetical protein NGA_0227400 [Nannochloropsis gaditana CCMP526]